MSVIGSIFSGAAGLGQGVTRGIQDASTINRMNREQDEYEANAPIREAQRGIAQQTLEEQKRLLQPYDYTQEEMYKKLDPESKSVVDTHFAAYPKTVGGSMQALKTLPEKAQGYSVARKVGLEVAGSKVVELGQKAQAAKEILKTKSPTDPDYAEIKMAADTADAIYQTAFKQVEVAKADTEKQFHQMTIKDFNASPESVALYTKYPAFKALSKLAEVDGKTEHIYKMIEIIQKEKDDKILTGEALIIKKGMAAGQSVEKIIDDITTFKNNTQKKSNPVEKTQIVTLMDEQNRPYQALVSKETGKVISVVGTKGSSLSSADQIKFEEKLLNEPDDAGAPAIADALARQNLPFVYKPKDVNQWWNPWSQKTEWVKTPLGPVKSSLNNDVQTITPEQKQVLKQQAMEIYNLPTSDKIKIKNKYKELTGEELM